VSPIEIIAVAAALAVDAFAVSVAVGVALRRVSPRQTFRLAWHFGLFQALMPVGGWYAGHTVHDLIAAFDHWVAFGLLVLVGGRMILGAVRNGGGEVSAAEPTRGWSLALLSIATSIDALAVGLSLAMLRVSVWVPALVIGLVTGALTAVGIHLGGCLGRRTGLARYAALAGGIVLLAIGARVLHEHGVL